MNGYIQIVPVDAVADDKPTLAEYNGYRIAIYRTEKGFRALNDICPHMGACISNGTRGQDVAVCPWHHWSFDLHTGACLNNPSAALETFPLLVSDGWLWLPEPPSDDLNLDAW